MIPVLFISIHYVFLTLSLPLYNFQKKISVQDNVNWNLLFSFQFLPHFATPMYLGEFSVWLFKISVNFSVAIFCNLWLVGLKLSRHVVIYIPFFWGSWIMHLSSTFNIFQPPSLIILPAILLNLQVILYGDQIPWNKQENVIVICNHQSSGTNFLKRQSNAIWLKVIQSLR